MGRRVEVVGYVSASSDVVVWRAELAKTWLHSPKLMPLSLNLDSASARCFKLFFEILMADSPYLVCCLPVYYC